MIDMISLDPSKYVSQGYGDDTMRYMYKLVPDNIVYNDNQEGTAMTNSERFFFETDNFKSNLPFFLRNNLQCSG